MGNVLAPAAPPHYSKYEDQGNVCITIMCRLHGQLPHHHEEPTCLYFDSDKFRWELIVYSELVRGGDFFGFRVLLQDSLLHSSDGEREKGSFQFLERKLLFVNIIFDGMTDNSSAV